MPDFGQAWDALASNRVQLARLVGNLRRLVADPLEVGDDTRNGHHQAKIARRRLPTGNQQGAVLVDADLVGVHFAITFDDLLHGLDVTTAEGVDRRLQLTFDQPPHLQDASPDMFQFKIELLAEMIAHWLALLSCLH
jgi:hypothetical protein